jgi:hypothetical protein
MMRFSRRTTLTLIALIAGVLTLAGCSSSSTPAWKQGDQYILSLRLEEGETFTGQMEMEQDIDMNMMGQSMQMAQTMTYDYGYAVVSRSEDGVITLEQTLERLRGSNENPMAGSQSYDTDDEESSSQVGEQMKAMIDVPIRMTITSKGDIQSVEGVEEIAARMQEEAMSEAQRKILEETLDAESFTQNMQTFAFYPDNPVAVGDTWDGSSQMNVGFPMQMDATYTLTEVKADTGYVDIMMDVYTPEDAEPMEMGGGTMTIDMTGTMSGTGKVDLVSGMMTSVTMDQQMEADATIDAQGRTMDMQMSITGTSTQTVSGLNDQQ